MGKRSRLLREAKQARLPRPEVDAHMRKVVEAWIRDGRSFKLWRSVGESQIPASEFFGLTARK